MKKYENEKEQVLISKKEYLVLFTMYHKAENEYSKFEIKKLFPDEDSQKQLAHLVRKNMATYLDNTNKVQLTLLGINSIANPPGLTREDQNEVCYMFEPPSKRPKYNWVVNHVSTITTPKAAAAKRNPGAPTKKDIVAGLLDQGLDPQGIFDQMSKDGVTTTLGSVRCFIKTIKDERAG